MTELLFKTAVLLDASEWCAERDTAEAAAALVASAAGSRRHSSSTGDANNHSSNIDAADPSSYSSADAGHGQEYVQLPGFCEGSGSFAVRPKMEYSSATASNSASASASASESPRPGASPAPSEHSALAGHPFAPGGPKMLGGLLDSLVEFASQELMIMKDDDVKDELQSAAAAAAAAPAQHSSNNSSDIPPQQSGRGSQRGGAQTYHDDGTPRPRYNRPRSISNPEGMEKSASWRGVNGSGRGNSYSVTHSHAESSNSSSFGEGHRWRRSQNSSSSEDSSSGSSSAAGSGAVLKGQQYNYLYSAGRVSDVIKEEDMVEDESMAGGAGHGAAGASSSSSSSSGMIRGAFGGAAAAEGDAAVALPHLLLKYANVYNKNGRIGIYTPQEREAIIARFKAKRQRRVWRKKIRYNCRKNLADKRLRIKGRFVKMSAAQRAALQLSGGSSTLNDMDECGDEDLPQQQAAAASSTRPSRRGRSSSVTSENSPDEDDYEEEEEEEVETYPTSGRQRRHSIAY